MSERYYELLDAAIQHLEELKARGVRFVPVSAEGLAELRNPPPARIARIAPASNPAATVKVDSPRSASPPPGAAPAAPRPASARTASISPAPLMALDLPGVGQADAQTPTVKPALTPEAKAAAFADLRQRALACVKCPHLASSRKSVVFGVGDPDARLMFIGEAPGADEDVQGEPFVGRAGQLLTKIIETMGLRRDVVYIANILKCRPDTPGQPTGNRKPTPEEMQTCIPFLHEQIDLVRPKVIVGLGATAIEGLLGNVGGITRLRGNWRVYRGIPLMPTYHPSYVLRPPFGEKKRQVWEDMLGVMEKLEIPISDKQRKFFSKG